MTNKEFKEYLNRWPDDCEPLAIIANPGKRIRYPVEETIAITDQKRPAIIFFIGDPIDFDAETVAAAEEDERKALDEYVQEMAGVVCDKICKHAANNELNEEGLTEICSECPISEYYQELSKRTVKK